VDIIKRIVPQIIKYGRAAQPGIGISVLRDDQKLQLLGQAEGVVVRDVERGLPADLAGVRGLRVSRGRLVLGDIIVGMGGEPVRGCDDLFAAFDRRKVGDVVEFTLLRSGKRRTARIELIDVY
jgi:2-alkenal reductase